MFISVTSHVVVVAIYNCLFLLSLHIPSVLGKCLSWLWLLAWWGDSDLYSFRVWVISSPAWIVSSDFNHITWKY